MEQENKMRNTNEKRSTDTNVLESEFCYVAYREQDQVVFLHWRRAAYLEQYRKPTQYALELMQRYRGSSIVIDATDGFEDDKRDVEWGFTYLLPEIAKTGCHHVAFIMKEVNETELEKEMDLWTVAFGRYFAVTKSVNYEEAVQSISQAIYVSVVYTIKEGKRMEFLNKVKEAGIIDASREEPGNISYEYYIPVDSEQNLCLMEFWVNETAQKRHGQTEQYARLTELKKEYLEHVAIQKYTTIVSR